MRILEVFASLTFLFSCSSGENIPDSILPPKKMEAIFWDVLRADELAGQFKLTDTARTSLQIHSELYDKIFSLHKISRDEFNKSFRFYQSRPDVFKPILENLSKRSDKAIKKD